MVCGGGGGAWCCGDGDNGEDVKQKELRRWR